MLAFVADSLERQGQFASASLVRWAHRRIVLGEPPTAGCERCGEPLDQKPTGRPRRWCSERCRKRTGKPILVP